MFVPLSEYSSSESENESRHFELGKNAVCQLSRHYRISAIERQSSSSGKNIKIVDFHPQYKLNPSEKRFCLETCRSGGKYNSSLNFKSGQPRSQIKRGYSFAGLVLSHKTSSLVPKYFYRSEKITLGCGLEARALKALCVSRMNCLRRLKLCDCRWLSNRSMRYLTYLPSLEQLEIKNSGRIKKGLFKLYRSQSLQKLNISEFSRIDNQLTLKLADTLAYTLHSLILNTRDQVFFNAKMEAHLQKILQKGSLKDVTIDGTTIFSCVKPPIRRSHAA